MEIQEKLTVRIIKKRKEILWYKVGEVYDVHNRIEFGWDTDCAHFRRYGRTHGICFDDCEILKPIPLKPEELTVEQVCKELGREIKIIK